MCWLHLFLGNKVGNSDRVLLHLSLIDGVGPATAMAIIRGCPDIDSVYLYNEHDFVARAGLSSVSAKKVVAGLADRSLLEKELALIERHGIQWTTVVSSDYPALLSTIYLPPTVLYWRGNLQLPERMLAVVGSRKATRYAQMAIERMVPDLVDHGVCVVSGGALGADSMAHTCTLESGGKTVAVLGSGLLELYPAANKKLFEAMVAEGGAVVSSFPLATTAHPGNFPARNRVIAGMSHACLVVQAAARSGALITAQYALDQGKEVLAVPGMINDLLSEGCHGLIRDGAFIATSAQDVLAIFGDLENVVAVGSLIPSEPESNQLSLSDGMGKNEDLPQADSLRGRLLQACTEPRALDELVGEVGVGAEEVMQELFDLQLAGKLQQNFAGLWQAV